MEQELLQPTTKESILSPIWHIQRPDTMGRNTATRIFCDKDLKNVAPYSMPMGGAAEHAGKVMICAACWERATGALILADPDTGEITQDGSVSPPPHIHVDFAQNYDPAVFEDLIGKITELIEQAAPWGNQAVLFASAPPLGPLADILANS